MYTLTKNSQEYNGNRLGIPFIGKRPRRPETGHQKEGEGGGGGGGGVACGRQHMTLTLRQAKCCLLQYVLYLWLEDYALEGSKF